MSGPVQFFGFNPRSVRIGLAVGAVGCAILAAWALANARSGAERFGVVRGGIAAGLMFTFGYVLGRLRPREGWGVTLDAIALVVSRPFSAEPIRLTWEQISLARQEVGRGRRLTVFLKTGERILVPQHLFASAKDFDAMARAVCEKAVPPRLDA